MTRGNQKDSAKNIKISWILIAQKHVDSVSVSITDIFALKNSHFIHKQHFLSHKRPRCNRISDWPTILFIYLFILLLNQDAKYEETTVPPQNTTAPTPSQSATPPSSDQEKTRPAITVVKTIIQRRPLNPKFAKTGNSNSKRGLPLFNREGNSALWSVNADTRITLPQPQQYDDMGGKENAWGEGTFYNGLYGEAQSYRKAKGLRMFRHQVYVKGGNCTNRSIWKGKKICHLGLWKVLRGLTKYTFYTCKKDKTVPGIIFYSY